MSGEPAASEAISDLAALLAQMAPRLHAEAVAIVFLAGATVAPAGLTTIGEFREAEGLTLYMDHDAAECAGLPVRMRAAWITLEVHSALDAIGLTAAFATALARAGIACNVVAGARHDHLFVPFDLADRALRALQDLRNAQPQGAATVRS